MSYREKCLSEKGESCKLCGAEDNIQIHHIDGDKLNNDLDNLAPVCTGCHSKIHSGAEGFEEWTERILPKRKRSRTVSVQVHPEDHDTIQTVKQVTDAESDQDAMKLGLELHAERIESMGGRKQMLSDIRSKVGDGTDDQIINAALMHLLESAQNMRNVSEQYAPNTIDDCCNTSVLELDWQNPIESNWR
jgi:hypothetical protein